MDLTEALALVEASPDHRVLRPTRYATLLQSGSCDRQAILQRIERDAFANVIKAYARLCDAPRFDCPQRRQLQRYVHDTKVIWARALADLDRSMSRPELSEAA
jgi:SUMO ligase MMS21 Smc5/6 complex component